jgi:PAS domain S-box-containing protein
LPPAIEYIRKNNYKVQSIEDTLSGINNSNALVEFDLQGNIVSANSLFSEMSGYSISELKKMNHSDLVEKSEIDESYRNFWRDLKLGRVKSGEYRRKTKVGKEFWIYANYNPIKDPYGDTYRILKIASDISEKKKGEEEIMKKNVYLEHAAKILRHDMHSGINTYIPRGLSSLKRRVDEEEIKRLKIESPLKMIEEGLIHTQKVYAGVKEFTNLVKPNAKLSVEKLDLKKILSEYLNSTSYSKQVIIEDLGEWEVNNSLFCTAVDNLIRNGLKYNDSSTKYVKIYSENGEIIVEDNGRGMDQEEFIELSKPYARRKNQREGGSGLGLNICIAIIQEHNLSVRAEKLNQGTKLHIKKND